MTDLNAVPVTLSYNEWVSVGACMTHALETGDEHSMAGFWGEVLAKLVGQIEAAPLETDR